MFVYGCSVAATEAARTHGNSDAISFADNKEAADEDEVPCANPTPEDPTVSYEEDIGYKVALISVCLLPTL